jgi:hypothetical protein
VVWAGFLLPVFFQQWGGVWCLGGWCFGALFGDGLCILFGDLFVFSLVCFASPVPLVLELA